MTKTAYRRYALYFMPRTHEPWVEFATSWLGWDAEAGREVDHPDVDPLPRPVAEITERPRKYGLHATIKAPFRLADGVSGDDLAAAAERLCTTLAPVVLDGVAVTKIGRFIALCPVGDETALNALAGACVEGLDGLRAPLTDAELAKRRAGRLSPAQDAYLTRWGYPYVMDEFRFHITLSGPLPGAEQSAVADVLDRRLSPLLPVPFAIDAMAVAGEAEDGRFHVLHRYALSG
ncbi:DUF1045 domain-containing protein [Chachezhania antarctica]|uniref:DUF1045 domain-containing protein n=1 Tax=Chachezhania antarctica TaxID=2340860 RepID=UPI000EADA2F8|nr:DUF1045 domain-containing protein [Chachezhania antarctica]|tara:strand:+ start:2845 stop:3543 length:699 start_codon:yes stop_codon:yes gene_type:complete